MTSINPIMNKRQPASTLLQFVSVFNFLDYPYIFPATKQNAGKHIYQIFNDIINLSEEKRKPERECEG
ncbi:hypothetical protein PRUPE_3G238200 [Prunus persica]|uniref:Uncharacterized protein n=1 Tax=Prunus persica TaxID=3760 RepID=A0A251Q4N2_PRUPE|nr:hypothetical protein PRUPE_3G238200 [Prunus persica]